jgi:GNAT superfamily N-acetyltransferase
MIMQKLNSERFLIRQMNAAELPLVLDWAKAEGWNPGLSDAKCFFGSDPKGFFLGCLGDTPIAAASCVRYDQHEAFAGLYIVKKPYRGQGYGLKLTQYLMERFTDMNIGLDGVLENVSLYERVGFKYYFQNHRYSGIARPFETSDNPNQPLVSLKQISFNQICQYDRHCFPAQRAEFLTCWIHQPNAISLGYLLDKKLMGYIVARPCHEGYKIGPLFADTQKIADYLLQAVQTAIIGETFYWDIPESNPAAIAMAKRYHLEPVFSTARMYNKRLPAVDYQKIFGITSFELG